MLKKRQSGILLHITSLPSTFGIGDLGPWAIRFADFLSESGQRIWQVLPLNPTGLSHGNSPYSSFSAFGNNPFLISPDVLLEQGVIDQADLPPLPDYPKGFIDFEAMTLFKKDLFCRIWNRVQQRGLPKGYQAFCIKNRYWLNDLALFVALKDHFQGRPWNEWPSEIKDRHPEALEWSEQELHHPVEKEKLLQYLFHIQWHSLKATCHQKGIILFGDIPIYVNYDSVDVWAHPGLFKLGDDRKPTVVSGVPPDYFSETGQLWGNPVYRWEALRETGYDWWLQRLQHNLELFDIIRIDHFRGLAGYWEVPAHEKTAINGKWVTGPGQDFLDTVRRHFPSMPIVAEDLGTITPDVKKLMAQFDLPGMKLLIFAFGDDLATNPYVPHNHVENCLIYTGTHDNNTIRGWFEKEMTPEMKTGLFQYLGREIGLPDINWEMIRLAMMSVANTAIFPMQDILGLGMEARMNLPASANGNWHWQLTEDQMNSELAGKLRKMTRMYGRL